MREGWRSAALGEVCELIKRGIAPRYTGSAGVRVVNQKCIRDHEVNMDLARRHDSAVRPVNSERYIKLGDVLVNSTGTGTLGRIAQVRDEPDQPTTVDTHVTIVRPRSGKFYPDFFGYMLMMIEDEIINSGEGASGQTELPRTKLENNFQVSYPESKEEQKRIVAILDEAFAGIATAVANTEKNLANARELFESYLNSVFGQRSGGWVPTVLGAAYDVRDGTHDSPKYVQSGRALVTSKNLRNGALDLTKVNYISEDDYLSISKRSGVHKGDVLFAMIGTIGNPVVVDVEPDFAIKNVALFKVGNQRSGQFLRYYLMSNEAITKMMADAKGTTQKFVGLGYLRQFPIKLPDPPVETQLVEEIVAIEIEITHLLQIAKQKLIALNELKQSLLQKAFSGELTAAPQDEVETALA